MRFFNVYGQGQGGNSGYAAVIPIFVNSLREGKEITIFGDGKQTRSFLYIEECLRGIRKLMDSECFEPLNIGFEEMVSINELAKITMEIANKDLKIKHIPGPLGVNGRNSDNKLIMEKLGWSPNFSLHDGIKKTYPWILKQVQKNKTL